MSPGLLRDPPTSLNVQSEDFDPLRRWPTLLRPPYGYHPGRCRNIYLLPITYAFRPRLRGRLTLGRLSLPRKPWAYGERVSHSLYRYSCLHKLFSGPTPLLTVRLAPREYSPTALEPEGSTEPTASASCLSPVKFSAQIHLTSELLRFL